MIGMQVFIIYWANPIGNNRQMRPQVEWKALSQGFLWRFWLNFQTKELFILNLRKQNHLCLLELSLIGARYNKLDARIMFPVEGEIIYSIVPLFSFSLSLFEFKLSWTAFRIYLSQPKGNNANWHKKKKHIFTLKSYILSYMSYILDFAP